LPWEDEDDADRVEPDQLLAAPGMHSADAELAALDRLIDWSQRCAVSAKICRLLRILDRVPEPVVIFTEYRDTLDAVCHALCATRRAGTIHGGVPTDVRRSIVAAFNSGDLDVLVATDAAGEGLNLHHRCRLVIDIELPWNPLRLEQRIGRVDRIGQARTVHAIRMFHAGTIEQRVLEHLRLRDRRAAAALDLHQPSEAAIAGAIFDGADLTTGNRIVIRSATIPSAAEEVDRIERARRARDLGAAATGGIVWTPARSRDHRGIILLHRRSYLDLHGGVIADQLQAGTLAIAPGNRRDQRIALEAARCHLKRTPAAAEVPGLFALAGCRERIETRINAIRALLQAERIESQASMFDRRADDLAAARRLALRRIDDGLSRVAAAIALPSGDRVRIDLVAAWPEATK
jgi:superfamily II DNA/RNA helicase